MKLLSAMLPLLCATAVTSSPLSLFGDSQQTLADTADLEVPGENPLTFCADPKDYILTIDNVDLDPNPPTPGANMTIVASGTFSKDVEKGAKVFLQVKYGLITLIKQEADLCDQISNVDLTCPLEKGKMTMTKSVMIPKQVPKGTYSVLADVYTAGGEKVTCLQSTVHF